MVLAVAVVTHVLLLQRTSSDWLKSEVRLGGDQCAPTSSSKVKRQQNQLQSSPFNCTHARRAHRRRVLRAHANDVSTRSSWTRRCHDDDEFVKRACRIITTFCCLVILLFSPDFSACVFVWVVCLWYFVSLLLFQTVYSDRRFDRTQVPGSVAEGHVRTQLGASRDSQKGEYLLSLFPSIISPFRHLSFSHLGPDSNSA